MDQRQRLERQRVEAHHRRLQRRRPRRHRRPVRLHRRPRHHVQLPHGPHRSLPLPPDLMEQHQLGRLEPYLPPVRRLQRRRQGRHRRLVRLRRRARLPPHLPQLRERHRRIQQPDPVLELGSRKLRLLPHENDRRRLQRRRARRSRRPVRLHRRHKHQPCLHLARYHHRRLLRLLCRLVIHRLDLEQFPLPQSVQLTCRSHKGCRRIFQAAPHLQHARLFSANPASRGGTPELNGR
ncbi:hypothetical protein SBRY_10870 [Actinacidiphila bryophytorum]|uniref:Uncharacterized protein n=1 Tax=Actinacidiphila bryophytorum TaxID=1436133 RepID=A0A9W4E264_9ACTN|nr:hypothetical protein SBRY_10870 [Actinacidiphila bryophytorum]